MNTSILKSALALLICLVSWQTVKAQNKPNNSNQGSSVSTLPTKVVTSSTEVNYVRVFDFNKPLSSVGSLGGYINSYDVMQNTQYFDGLGRPLQTVARKALPGGFDLVDFSIYDQFGRQVYKPMPFQSTSSSGELEGAPSSRLSSFASSFYPDEDVFYSKTEYDDSPLNRVTKQMAPGNSWAGSNRGAAMQYATNTIGNGVRKFASGDISLLTGQILVTLNGTYAVGELSLIITTDENDQQIRQFTDKRGQVILKQVQKGNSTADAHSNWLNTYYVYDKKGNLSVVIPPRAVELLESASWNYNSANILDLVFEYTYDGRNRMITKRVPGAEIVEMVYDKLDRLVASRDGNQASNGQWLFTKYDVHNRPVLTGLINSSNTRATMQSQANANGVFHVSTEALNTSNVLEANSIALSHHISGTQIYRSKTTIEFLPGFDSNGQYFETEISPALSTDYTFEQGYYDATFPLLTDYGYEILSVSYFDNYEFTTRNYSSSYEVDFYSAGTNNAVNPAQYSKAQGLATGSRTRVLGSDTWLTTVMYYDDKGRVVQTYADNHLGGLDVSATQYDFSGKVLNTYMVHKNPMASGADAQTTIAKRMTYDQAGRLLTIQQRLNGGSYKVIASHTYDAMGQLESKQLGSGIETLNYDYNIRGWLKSINDGYVDSGAGNYFGMRLSYDYGFEKNNYNGNISGVEWRSEGNDRKQAYGYEYDESNRLEKADFNQLINSNWVKTQADFSTEYGYDANGNIENLTRKGLVLGNIQTLDQLVYTYANSNRSNQLVRVSDSRADYGIGDFGDGNTSGDDYAYDDNGNMTQDLNKDIQSGDIEYNHLNLPKKVTFGNSSSKTISYTYDAAGIKLAKTVNDGGQLTTTDYVGGFIYTNNDLQHMAHDEGRVRKNSAGSLVYDYFIKDHLGNTRVTLTEESNLVNVYKATMETENDVNGDDIDSFEEQYFYNLDATRTAALSAANKSTQADDGCTSCNESAITNGTTKPVGPAILLDVMPGDELDLEAWAYNQGSINSGTSRIATSTLATSLASAFVPSGNSELINQTQSLFNGISGDITGGGSSGSTRPFAYLNYILFDSEFNVISDGHDRVQDTPNTLQLTNISNINISEKGFIYIWVSNESNQNMNVYWDDIKVTHTKGQILQEDHYYPGGATISALSSSAPLSTPNRYKFNGNEIQTDFDLNLYDFNARMYDPVLSRFTSVDPLADDPLQVRYSPYQYAWNNPILLNDPSGECPDCWEFIKGVGRGIASGATGTWNFVTNDAWKAETWEATGNLALGLAVMGGNPANAGNVLKVDEALGTNSAGAVTAFGESVQAGIDKVQNGSAGDVGEVVGEVLWGVAEGVVGSKGVGAITKTSSTAAKVASKVDDLAGPSLWRGDSRPPSEILKNGFSSRGSDFDLHDHALGVSDNSAYISTSRRRSVAEKFAGKNGYVYQIKGNVGGRNVNQTLGRSSPHPMEFEVAVPFRIPPSKIIKEVRTGAKN